jgi:hypothetical protein
MGEADRDFVSNLCHYHGYRFCDVVVALELAPLLLAFPAHCFACRVLWLQPNL